MPSERTYRRSDRGPAVAEVRSKLSVLGLLPPSEMHLSVSAAAVFDETTERAVRAFQQQRGLPVDGVVGPRTYHALDEARWRLGDRILVYVPARLMAGDDVAALQQRLLDMGFDCGRVDGLFGVETGQALREFQRNVGIVADGTCGPGTLHALNRLARTVVGGAPHAMRESEAINRAGPTLSGKLVILDPGHSLAGHRLDPDGAGLRPDVDRLVYDLAARVEGRLTATGCSAFLTRGPDTGSDETATEEQRAGFANGAAADLLISVHVATHPNPAASGVATYFYGNDRYGHHSALGERFAGLVQREVCARTDLVDCRSHPMNWELLRRTRMPAVRIEIGYVTSPGDSARLADPDFRDVVAEGIVAAVQRLYLPADQDAETGMLRIPALRA